MGSKVCIETNDNESFTNYGRVGFELQVDTRLVPLMLLGDHGRPNIGFGSHDGCHFGWLLVDFGLGSTQEMKSTPWFAKVSTIGFVIVLMFISFLVDSPYFSSLFCLVVCRCQGWRREAWLKDSSLFCRWVQGVR